MHWLGCSHSLLPTGPFHGPEFLALAVFSYGSGIVLLAFLMISQLYGVTVPGAK